MGYRVDEEGKSLANYCCVVALRYWSEEGDSSFSTYLTQIFIRSVARLQKWKYLQVEDEYTFIDRKLRHDFGQRFLMTVPEPMRSACFAVWVERRQLQEVANEAGITLTRLHSWLESIRKQLIRSLDDEPRHI